MIIPSPSNTEHTSFLIDELFGKIRNEQTYQDKLICYSDIAMVIIDRKSGRFLFANHAAELLYNRKSYELQQLTLNSITEIGSLQEIEKGFAALEAKKVNSYKIAKVCIVPPNNERKIAFMEMVEISKVTRLESVYWRSYRVARSHVIKTMWLTFSRV